MPVEAAVSEVNEERLGASLRRLALAIPRHSDVTRLLGDFVRTAQDDELVRINPVRFATERELSTAAVVELFLHARKLGLLTMEWQYVCPGCCEVVERLTPLISGSAHKRPRHRLAIEKGSAELKGVAGEVTLHRLRDPISPRVTETGPVASRTQL
jgi:hypothetical protein